MTIGADIYKYIEAPLRLNYPCHSQTVEHALQITTLVVLLSTNYESWLGAAFANNDYRKEIPGRASRKILLKYKFYCCILLYFLKICLSETILHNERLGYCVLLLTSDGSIC